MSDLCDHVMLSASGYVLLFLNYSDDAKKQMLYNKIFLFYVSQFRIIFITAST